MSTKPIFGFCRSSPTLEFKSILEKKKRKKKAISPKRIGGTEGENSTWKVYDVTLPTQRSDMEGLFRTMGPKPRGKPLLSEQKCLNGFLEETESGNVFCSRPPYVFCLFARLFIKAGDSETRKGIG
uniref:Uncharacterized protein n=1 Tax=Pipistrellus kuhlii TaxID=59472 RepID=A0A7J7UTV7_PIPKU|nr:hypothetical protein mPipKuh1_008717 [Pipistrellus kuhlii]